MNKIDVLVLCQYFYPEYVSSATLPLEMAEDFVISGLSVGVLCGYPKEYLSKGENDVKEYENYNGIYIKRVKYMQLERKHPLSRLINQISFVVAVLFRIRYILKHKCVIVYSDPPMLPIITSMLKRISRLKYVFVAYDIFPDIAIAMGKTKDTSIMTRAMNFINKSVYSSASKIVALSEEMKEHILKCKLPDGESKVKVIPNWHDKNKLKYGKIISGEIRSIKQNAEFAVLYSGNMGICQDMDTIVKAIFELKDHKDIIFIFTGHGNKARQIRETIKENKLSNVRFYDFLLGDDYSDVLQIADCHIVSLEKGIEGLCVPSKTYSYLAAGRTLLAIMSQNTDTAKIIKEYNAGFTFDQGDYTGLSKTILYLYDNREENKRIGENARKAFLDLYERNICTGKYINLVNDLINKNVSNCLSENIEKT